MIPQYWMPKLMLKLKADAGDGRARPRPELHADPESKVLDNLSYYRLRRGINPLLDVPNI
jgi:hypothetical protein